jgi:16S rRNA (guanine527-N7)-methyltransferase
MLTGKYTSQLTEKQIEQLKLFANLLQDHNKRLNLTRISETEHIWSHHFEDSLQALAILRELEAPNRKCSLVDIGSGGGFPALVLAVALPDWDIVSIEATGKKARFQHTAAEKMGLKNIEIYPERAEKLANQFDFRGQFDAGVTRAMGRLSIIAELTMPFIRRGGKFICWKGPKLEQELPAGRAAIELLGGSDIKILPYSLPGVENSGYRLLEAVEKTPSPGQYPRDYKAIKAAPLGEN